MIRVLVIIEATLVRHGVVALLDHSGDTEVVAQTDSLDDGIRLVGEFRPDVIVVTVEGWDGPDAAGLARLTDVCASTRVLVLADELDPEQLDVVLRAGVEGIAPTSVTVPELEDAIAQLAQGRSVLHPDATSVLATRKPG